MWVVVGAGAQVDVRCYDYPVDRLGVRHVVFGQNGRTSRTETLKAFRVFDRSRAGNASYPILVEYIVAGGLSGRQTVYCYPKSERVKWCGVECDGGGFALDKEGRLRPDVMTLQRQEGEDAETGSEWIVYPIEANITLIGQAIPRPSDLPKYYWDDPEGLHVCYDAIRDHEAYVGCYRSVQPCARRQDHAFGTYSTRQASRTALERCESSYPDAAYIDNPVGRFVCYENRDDRGYHGCFRSTESCRKLHKKRFGHYPDGPQSRAALDRCKKNRPKR
jgi:hypothetical protein